MSGRSHKFDLNLGHEEITFKLVTLLLFSRVIDILYLQLRIQGKFWWKKCIPQELMIIRIYVHLMPIYNKYQMMLTPLVQGFHVFLHSSIKVILVLTASVINIQYLTYRQSPQIHGCCYSLLVQVIVLSPSYRPMIIYLTRSFLLVPFLISADIQTATGLGTVG